MKELFNIEKVRKLTKKVQEKQPKLDDPVVESIQKALDRADLGCSESHVQEIINALLDGMGKRGIVRDKTGPYIITAWIRI